MGKPAVFQPLGSCALQQPSHVLLGNPSCSTCRLGRNIMWLACQLCLQQAGSIPILDSYIVWQEIAWPALQGTACAMTMGRSVYMSRLLGQSARNSMPWARLYCNKLDIMCDAALSLASSLTERGLYWSAQLVAGFNA